MNKKSALVAGAVAVLALGMAAAASGVFAEAAGEDPQKPSAPRYSETCAHGHNGFACDPPRHKADIADLQKRTADLEYRVSQMEKR